MPDPKLGGWVGYELSTARVMRTSGESTGAGAVRRINRSLGENVLTERVGWPGRPEMDLPQKTRYVQRSPAGEGERGGETVTGRHGKRGDGLKK